MEDEGNENEICIWNVCGRDVSNRWNGWLWNERNKSTANQQESQKERDMKEADKAAMVYIRELIELDSSKLEALLYKPYEFIEGGKTYPGISKEMKERYDLYRYDLKEEKEEYYYHVVYFDPVEKGREVKI